MTKNSPMSAYLSAVNRAYSTAAGSAAAQTRAAVQAQQAQLKRDILSVQHDMTQAWLDLWMPTGGSSSGRRGSSGKRRARSGGR